GVTHADLDQDPPAHDSVLLTDPAVEGYSRLRPKHTTVMSSNCDRPEAWSRTAARIASPTAATPGGAWATALCSRSSPNRWPFGSSASDTPSEYSTTTSPGSSATWVDR